MEEIIVYIIIAVTTAVMMRILYNSVKKHKWFMKLKPGDKVLVSIYSQYCECLRNAEITKKSNGKYIEANVTEDCKNCAESKSRDNNEEITCWYNIKYFKKSDVCEMKNKI